MTVAVLALALLALPDDGSDAALEKFKADLKGKDAAGRAEALSELAKTQSPKIAARLNGFLLGDVPEVRVAAAAGLALQTEHRKAVVPYLLRGAAANAKSPAVLAAIVTALGKLGDPAGAAEVDKHFGAEPELAKAAVEAAGKIKNPTSFEPLIKELKACETALKPRDPNDRFGANLGSLDGPGANSREARARARELQPLIHGVLAAWAGVSCESAKDWEAWWKENRHKFRAAR